MGQRPALAVIELDGQLRSAQAFEYAGFGHGALRMMWIPRILAGRQRRP
jgi:hypothetical protein